MEKKLIAFVRCTCAEGSVTKDRAYNADVSFTADGDYNVTIGKGGADSLNTAIEIEAEAAAGDAVGKVPSCIPTSDTVKRIQFRTAAAGALVEPVGFAVSIFRMSPSIAV